MSKCRSWFISIVGIAIVGGIIFYFFGAVGFSGNDCDPISQTNSIPSPDGKLEALVLHQGCSGGFGSGSETYWIKVRRTGPRPGDEGLNIFEVQRYLPDVAWPAPARLAITIKVVSYIPLSLHKAYDADVVYRIDDNLQPAQWEQEIKKYEAQSEQRLRDGKTFTGNPAADRQFRNEAVARARRDYAVFLNWAASNAENAPH